MITVITVFYHPDLGMVRGILIKGKPMLACRDLAALLVGPHVEETEKIMRRLYGAMDITVPAAAGRNAGAVTEKLLFVDEDAVFRMIECTSNRAWERYVAWFNDYVFPSLSSWAVPVTSTEMSIASMIPAQTLCLRNLRALTVKNSSACSSEARHGIQEQ